MSPGALAGLRVLDLSQVLAGPFCTQMLADHGAEVIKIEPPEGDPARRFAPFRADDTERAFGGYFQSINRGKKSVVLDLKDPAGRAAFLKLVAGADVLVENYRAGVMERLGLGYETLARINPRLVYGAIRGFGDPRSGESPYNDWPAFDVVAQAMGGIMGITGPTADQPLKIGPGVGDTVPALMLAFGILAAVRHAERSGQGQFVDISMIDGVLALCERLVHQYSYAGEVAGPEGNGHPLLCPFGLFRAADGWVAIGCPTDKFWVELAAAIGRPGTGDRPRLGHQCGAPRPPRRGHDPGRGLHRPAQQGAAEGAVRRARAVRAGAERGRNLCRPALRRPRHAGAGRAAGQRHAGHHRRRAGASVGHAGRGARAGAAAWRAHGGGSGRPGRGSSFRMIYLAIIYS